MTFEEVFIPYLLRQFSAYLADMTYSVDDARGKGAQFFVQWLSNNIDYQNIGLDEDEDSQDPDQEALLILASFLESEELWIDEFWPLLLISQRGLPVNQLEDFHAAFVVRWKNGKVFSYVCTVPPTLVSPRGHLSDYLVTKIAHVGASQFHDMVAERSLDALHDVQQLSVSKETIREVLALATEAAQGEGIKKRKELEAAIHFLRSISIPLVPPLAARAAKKAMPNYISGKGRWGIISIEPEDEEE